MKRKNKKLKLYFLIMLILLLISAITLRIDHYISKTIGIVIFPFVLVMGFVIITTDK